MERSFVWRSIASEAAPERPLRGLDRVWDVAAGVAQRARTRTGPYLRRAEHIASRGSELRALTDEVLREHALEMRTVFRRGRAVAEDIDRAVAIVRESARRALGLEAYPVQLAGALAMHDGAIAELATGEGKTLVAVIPAVLRGWRGRGCHVVTVNDYLARRDMQWMAPVYERCGVTVSAITGEDNAESRRVAYAADVTYTTNKEVAADFLRDQLELARVPDRTEILLTDVRGGHDPRAPRLLQRGLEAAIVDEADAVLIDEAVTPLIISGREGGADLCDAARDADRIARTLTLGAEFRIDRTHREVRLTARGRARVHGMAQGLGPIWSGRRRAEEFVEQALVAHHLHRRESNYIVREGRVVIIDEFTGRLMPDRTWRAGLHQAIEAKEGLEIQPPKDTHARVSFQRLFRSYRSLCGMSGTAWDARGEFWSTYRAPVVRIPTHRPIRRELEPTRVASTSEARWDAIADEAASRSRAGRPVLVGTRTVEASEHLSAMLAARGVEHAVLNAVRHEQEAEIVAEAGRSGRVTIATNMAGRGTDIRLDAAAAAAGGLHVIVSEPHESRRIDRQLIGRAGRQGDPGSGRLFVSLEDEVLDRHARHLVRISRGLRVPTGQVVRWAQVRAESLAATKRRGVARADEWLDRGLGFAGKRL
jgi:preprotein translocase subunit SecA